MASLYRRSATGPWWVAWTDSEGKRQRKSTRTKVKAEAQLIAQELEKGPVAENRHVYRILDYAAKLKMDGKLSRARGLELIRDMMEDCPTVDQFAEEWLLSHAAQVRAASLKIYRSKLNTFLEWLGERRHYRLDELRTRDFEEYLRSLPGGPQAINAHQAVLKMLMSRAEELDYVAKSPLAPIKKLQKKESHKLPFTQEEVGAILKEADHDWKGMVYLGLYTGMRITDAAQLRWSSVKLEARVIDFIPKKSRKQKRLIIPIHDTLFEYLLERPSTDEEDAYVFPNIVAVHKSSPSRLFTKLAERAGVDLGAQQRGANSVRAKTFHSLRHTIISWMANAGISEELRREVTGHASPQIHQDYTHLSLDSVRDAIAQMPRF